MWIIINCWMMRVILITILGEEQHVTSPLTPLKKSLPQLSGSQDFHMFFQFGCMSASHCLGEKLYLRLEQYFKAMNTNMEEAKVTLTIMHLSEDANLWRRSQYVDIQEGRCTIDTWEILKRELRSQFFSKNVEILARRKLRELKHTGTIQKYVKQFAGLMLDISDMTENDKIFSFVEGLQGLSYTNRKFKTSPQET